MFPPLIALLGGILVSPCLDPTPVWICLPLAILLSFARRWCALLAVTLLGAGIASIQPTVPPVPGGIALRVVGKLRKAPEWRGLGVYLEVQLQTLDNTPYHGRARLVEFLDDPELRRLFDALDLGSGDRVEIVVKLHRPAVYRDSGVFDFRSYLEREGIYWTGTIRNPRLITVLERGWHGADRIKNWIHLRLAAPFSEDREIQGLVMGMVLGRKYGLTAKAERQFQAGGIYHLVVVSGFNLAVVAGAAFWLARYIFRKRRARLLFVLTFALLYSTIVDGQAPVQRAALMVSLVVIGKLLDRGHSPMNAVAATAFVMLLINPGSIKDESFEMTFAAVLAVIGIGVPACRWAFGWIHEALDHFHDSSKDTHLPVRAADWRVSRRVWCELHGLPPWVITGPWKIILVAVETLVISMCVEMVFLIFMVESFHRVSPISPLVNVPAGAIATAVTPLGLLLILLPWPGAPVIAWIVTHLLRALLKILDVILQFPGATLRVPSSPAWLWIVYAVCVTAVIIGIRKRHAAVCLGGFLAVVLLQTIIALGDFSPKPPRAVTLTFLDVGQGDSCLIEFPSGRRMLIDGGGVAAGRFLNLQDESTFSIGENVVSAYLFSRRIRRIDTVVLTHAHHDHMDGLFDVIRNFKVGEFWLGRNSMTPRYRDLIQLIQKKQIPIRWVSAGQMIGPFTVLHPPADWIPRRKMENDDSVVLLLTTGSETTLLTGDIERRIQVPPKVDVMKVSHHGSKGVRIQVAATVRVISVGANNPFGHPHESVLPAFRTDLLGALTVTLTGDRPQVTSWQADASLTHSCSSCNLLLFLGSH